MHTKIARTAVSEVIAARIRNLPLHRGHSKTSTANTRYINSEQESKCPSHVGLALLLKTPERPREAGIVQNPLLYRDRKRFASLLEAPPVPFPAEVVRLLRAHGLEDLRQRIRNHIAWAREAAAAIASLDGFRLTTECHLSLFTFQYAPEGEDANHCGTSPRSVNMYVEIMLSCHCDALM